MNLRAGLVGVAWLLVINFTRAGPPFVTDDPETPPPGSWEINIPFILEHTSGATEMDAPRFDLNYGLPDIQLKLEFPIEIEHEDHTGTAAGLGDMLLGVKWRFYNDEKSQLQIGTYPQLLVPTGDESHDLGEGRVAFVLPLVAQKTWDKWTLYGNLGFWWQTASEKRNYVYAGTVLEREFNDRLSLGVELFGNSPKECGGRSEIAFNVGGTWRLNKHLNVIFSGGRDIMGDTHAMAYIGLQILTK